MTDITLEQVRNFHKGCARLDLPETGRPMAGKEHLAFADAIDAAIKQRDQDDDAFATGFKICATRLEAILREHTMPKPAEE